MAVGGVNKWTMTPPRKAGGIPQVSIRFRLSAENEQADARRAVEPVSRDRILRRERGQENIYFPCSADHEQDWKHYPVDPYSK